MTAVAALESGQGSGRAQGPSALTVAAYVGGGALLIGSLALLAAFYNLRDVATEWPPKDVDFNEYRSVMLTATMLLSGGVVTWATNAARLGNRRQALAGLVFTAGLGGAFLNLAWYTGSQAGFGPSSHAFGAVVLTSLALGAAAVIVGIAFLAVALLHTQLRGDAIADGLVGAVARFWWFVVAAWLVSPVALYGLMSAK